MYTRISLLDFPPDYRIAEALVTSEESHMALSKASDNETVECKQNVHKYSEEFSLEGDRSISSPHPPDVTLNNQPVFEGSEKLSRIRLSSSADSSIPSPTSFPTKFAQSKCLNPYPYALVNPVNVNKINPSKQVHQGLLYNLLISKETSSQNLISSKTLLSVPHSQSLMETYEMYKTNFKCSVHFFVDFRIAEALVTSEESHMALSKASDNETVECKQNVHKYSEEFSLEGDRSISSPHPPDVTLNNQPVFEGSEKLSRIRLSSSADSSIPSPTSFPTKFAQSKCLNPYPYALVNPVNVNKINPSKQVHQGLLYNLLISKETSSQNLISSKTLLSVPHSQSLMETYESMSGSRTDKKLLDSPVLLDSHHTDTSNYSSSFKTSTVYSNFRHRANSLGCKVTNNRPYTRPHASSVGAASDCYPNLKARLQHRRQMDVLVPDSIFSKPKHTLYHRTLSKSHENAMNNSHIDIRSHSLSTSSVSSSGVSSPRVHSQSLSANARILDPSPTAITQSSGFSSACLQQSPQTSSLSNDSGSDEPIDLTGYSVPVSPVTTTFSLPHITPGAVNKQNGSCPYVQLAKKTARPVQARITEWLRQITEFVALSTPLVSTLKPKLWTIDDLPKQIHYLNNKSDTFPWLSLLSQCWQKLLALSMVEYSLDVVVVEDKSSYEECQQYHDPLQLEIPWSLLVDIQKCGDITNRRPDRKFANELLQFLSEIRQAGLSAQEFYLLRHVILLTVDEPDTLPTLGLNVIRASRCMNSNVTSHNGVDQSNTVANLLKDGTQASVLSSDIEPPTVTFDLACLACGLKALRSMCPHRIASLFCSHLRNSSILNQKFIFEMHIKYLSALKDLQTLSVSQITADVISNNGSNNIVNNNGMKSNINISNKHSLLEKIPVNKKSILEQLFDSA
ncbi:hypothetical protein MN116_003545 [Schistosoma mekongi]|uniref:Uncharacterized protein n=1 Tax=Schistosoma mekongi TaxID=38744 RepID=A0AAE1ZEB1_SCHME|nr:hypothetical protein MN116_003545 [Schistosoma mekongi]